MSMGTVLLVVKLENRRNDYLKDCWSAVSWRGAQRKFGPALQA
jgi:hypothetical protein